MLGKLAYRNVKRSLKDYLIYLITIMISFSLIFAFNLVASSDEVVELSVAMQRFRGILSFINVVIVFVICFLVNYTTRFMFEKRSRELGTYMLLGIKKKEIANLLVIENVLLGLIVFVLSIPLGFVFSQFIALFIVKLLGIPEVVLISVNFVSIKLLAIYFVVIYALVLVNMLRKIRKMTVHDFLYLDKQNEKKMFRSSKKRNVIFIISVMSGVVSLVLWNYRFTPEKIGVQETTTFLAISIFMLIISIYGVSATCADMFLSLLLKSKKLKYQKDNLFVARTFASKTRTMSFTFGTLSVLIVFSLLCLNFSSINKGMYNTTIQLYAPYDVMVMGEDKKAFEKHIQVVDENYTIEETLEYDIYKGANHQIQDCFDTQFNDFDPVMKLSDYNKLLELRNMTAIELKDDEYFLVADKQLLHNVANSDGIKNIRLADKKELNLKGTDTKSYWYFICNMDVFVMVVPDEAVKELNLSESHLIIDTKEETTGKLQEEIERQLVKIGEDGEKNNQDYRVMVRGSVIEEQNTMTAIIASICLYIAVILIAAVGTILAVQSLSDAAKYKYRYLTLRRLGVNDKSLFKTIRKQLFVLFGVPVVCSAIVSFCMVLSMNHVYQIYLESKFSYLLYFISSLAIFFLVYGIYWIATYIGFKRNINEEKIPSHSYFNRQENY